MFWNCYAFTRTGERVVIDRGLPEAEARARCADEAAFIQQMGDPLFLFGDHWYEPGFVPRVVLHPAAHDPFRPSMRDVWLPNLADL